MAEDSEKSTSDSHASAQPTKRRWWITALIWACTLVVVSLTAVLVYQIATRERPSPETRPEQLKNVEVWTIEPRDYAETLRLPARVQADRSVEVSAEIQGRVLRWETEEAATVRKGQPLLNLDVDLLRAQRRELDSALEIAKLDRDHAEREYERIKKLAADNIASESELDAAKTRRDRTASVVRQTQRQIESLDVRIAKGTVYAPFAGTLDEHLVEVGAVVSPGQIVARVYDHSHCRVQVDVADRYIPFLEVNNEAVREYIRMAMPGGRQEVEAHFTIPGLPKLTGGKHRGVRVPAEVWRISQSADPASNTFRVELRFENPGAAFREGMLGQAEVQFLVYPQAIVVPLQSIRVTEAGPRAVVVESREGRDIAVVRDVEPVSIQKDQVLVRNGLKGGERLVIAGGKGVVHGERVRVLVSDGAVNARLEEGGAYELPKGYRPGGNVNGEEAEETP